MDNKILKCIHNRFHEIYPTIKTRSNYLVNYEENILPDINVHSIENDFIRGRGNELEKKFKAIHSSSAFAVNNFGYWRDNTDKLEILGFSNFSQLEFEYPCLSGLPGTSPNLDIVISNNEVTIGIESKFLEITSKQKQHFSASYNEKKLPHAENFIFDLITKYNGSSSYLETAQLIKHYLGLIKTFVDKEIILLYLFWLPINYSTIEIYNRHREELDEFQNNFKSKKVKFISMSYLRLWDSLFHMHPTYKNKILQRYYLNIE